MPRSRDLHIDKLLTQLSIGFYNDPEEYFADKFFPSLPGVTKRSDIIPRYEEDAWLRDEAQIRAKGDESFGSNYDVNNDLKYYCENYAFHHDIPWEDDANTDPPYDLQRDGTEFVTDKILMKRDTIFIARYLATGVWTGETDLVAAPWSNPSSNPIEDVEAARLAMSGRIGREGKRMLMGRTVFSALKQHPDILARIVYTQRGVITKDIIAAMFEVERIEVPNAIKNTAKEGQTKVKARMVGNVALLVYVTPKPALIKPTAGYIINWKMPPINTPIYIRRFSLTSRMIDRIEGHTFLDMVKTSADAGHYFYNVI